MSHADTFGLIETEAGATVDSHSPPEKAPGKPRFAFLEFLAVVICTAMVSLCLGPAFSGFWAGISIAMVAFSFATYATIQRRIPEAVLFGFIGLVIAAINLPTVFQMFPLQQPVRAATFQDVTIAEVLHHAAQSKDNRPYWKFSVSDRKLAEKRINFTIPPGTSLEDVLETLKADAGVSYRWNWFSPCGMTTQPAFAHFHITNGPSDVRDEYEVMIDRNGINELPRE